jgi:hypothetical protein
MRLRVTTGATRAAWTAAIVVGLLIGPFARPLTDLRAAPEERPETRALDIVRAVQQAQAMYRSVHGYYDRLECLVQASCVPNPYPPSYLSPNALRSTGFGYRFRLHEGGRVRGGVPDPVSPTALQAFAMVAMPVEDPARHRAFCGDDSGEIYVTSGSRAPAVEDGRCVDTSRPLR